VRVRAAAAALSAFSYFAEALAGPPPAPPPLTPGQRAIPRLAILLLVYAALLDLRDLDRGLRGG